MHVHVEKGEGNGKIWHNFSSKETRHMLKIVRDEIVTLKTNGMSTSQNRYDAMENLIFKEVLRINSVDFSNSLDKMFVRLTNKLVFVIPTQLYNSLKNAKSDSLHNLNLNADRTGIYWPDLDEDLSLKGFLKDYLKQKVQTEKELVLL